MDIIDKRMAQVDLDCDKKIQQEMTKNNANIQAFKDYVGTTFLQSIVDEIKLGFLNAPIQRHREIYTFTIKPNIHTRGVNCKLLKTLFKNNENICFDRVLQIVLKEMLNNDLKNTYTISTIANNDLMCGLLGCGIECYLFPFTWPILLIMAFDMYCSKKYGYITTKIKVCFRKSIKCEQ
jgi:hypothetical protein